MIEHDSIDLVLQLSTYQMRKLEIARMLQEKDRRIAELEALEEGNSMHLTTLNQYVADVRERDKRIAELEARIKRLESL